MKQIGIIKNKLYILQAFTFNPTKFPLPPVFSPCSMDITAFWSLSNFHTGQSSVPQERV